MQKKRTQDRSSTSEVFRQSSEDFQVDSDFAYVPVLSPDHISGSSQEGQDRLLSQQTQEPLQYPWRLNFRDIESPVSKYVAHVKAVLGLLPDEILEENGWQLFFFNNRLFDEDFVDFVMLQDGHPDDPGQPDPIDGLLVSEATGDNMEEASSVASSSMGLLPEEIMDLWDSEVFSSFEESSDWI